MKRHNQILAGLLVVQIVISAVLFWPRSSAATGKSEPVFPDLKAEEIVSLTITDDQGNTVSLKKEGGDWVLADADGYPAQADRVTTLLDKLVGLTTGRLVARTDASQRRLQVADDDFVRRIRFETADGEEHVLYLGSSPSYGATHFRLGGETETYLTDNLTAWDVGSTATAWVNTTYLEVPFDAVTKMTLENKNGTFVFTKDEEGHWTMEGLGPDESLKESAVTTMLRRATKVNLAVPLGKTEKPEYGLDEPNAIVTLETGERTVVLKVGARNPDDETYVVGSSESPYYVRVSEFAVQHMVEDGRDDFVPPPVTPTPAP